MSLSLTTHNPSLVQTAMASLFTSTPQARSMLYPCTDDMRGSQRIRESCSGPDEEQMPMRLGGRLLGTSISLTLLCVHA